MGTDSIEVPIFYGDDPEEVEPWVSWIGDFAYDQGFSDFETRQFAYGFMEGEAHDWYCEELSRSVFRSWADLKLRLFIRFSKRVEDTKTVTLSFQDRMKQLSNLLDLWNEEDEAKKQREEERLAPESYSTEVPSHVGGSLMSFSPEPIQPMIMPEKKFDLSIEFPLLGSDHVTEVKVCEKECLENLLQEEQSGVAKRKDVERNEHARQVFDQMIVRGKRVRKKKRWKKLAQEISKPYRKSEGSRKIDGITGKDVVEELFGFNNTSRKDGHKQGKDKLSKAVMKRYGCQVLDEMSLSEKKVTKKKKRRRKKTHPSMNLSTAGENYHWLVANHVFDRRMLLIFTKGKIKMKMERTVKCLKHSKKIYERKINKHEVEFSKLLQGYLTALKKLVKWRKGKFKQKHNMPINIKERFLGNKIAYLWVSKLEHGVFRKIFRRWFKKKRDCEKNYRRCDNVMQHNGRGKLDMELLLAAKARKRAKSKHRRVVHGTLLWFVPTEGTKLLMELKKYQLKYTKNQLWNWRKKKQHGYLKAYQMQQLSSSCIDARIYVTLICGIVKAEMMQSLTSRKKVKFRKKHRKNKVKFGVVRKERGVTLLHDLLLLRKEVIDKFSLMNMRFWPEVAKKSKMFKDVLMHISENQIRGLASQLNDIKHSVFEEVQGEGIHKRVELTLQIYKGIIDGLPLEMDCSYVLLRLQGIEILKNLGVKLEETEDGKKKKEELKEKFEGMCKVVNAVLEDKVEMPIMSDCVVHSPCCLVTGDYNWTADMDRHVKVQAMGNSSMSGYMPNKKTVEINPKILIVGEMRKRADADKYNKPVGDIALLLFETALLTSKFIVNKPNIFGSRIHRMLEPRLRSHDEQVENRTIQMLLLVKWLSELCVPTVLAATQVQMTCTEVEMDQGQRVNILLRNGDHSNASKTKEAVGKLLYWEEMVIAGLLQFLPILPMLKTTYLWVPLKAGLRLWSGSSV